MIKKVIRDGKVAVLVSPGFGAGWSTWSDSPEAAAFDPEVVAWVEDGKPQDRLYEMEETWEERFGYLGGMDDLQVRWVPQGIQFTISEYDGSETLQVVSPDWVYVA